MPAYSFFSPHRRAARVVLLAAALLGAAGCEAYYRQTLEAQPGLADVRPTGPKGQKCYDFCAQAEVACKHMCPQGTFVGDCADDCVLDTKGCLKDCPEMWRPPIPEN